MPHIRVRHPRSLGRGHRRVGPAARWRSWSPVSANWSSTAPIRNFSRGSGGGPGYVELGRKDGAIEIGPPDAGFGGGLQPTITLSPSSNPQTGRLPLHIDVNPVDPDQNAGLERLLALGARPADVGQTGSEQWHVLADPPKANSSASCASGLTPDRTPGLTQQVPSGVLIVARNARYRASLRPTSCPSTSPAEKSLEPISVESHRINSPASPLD
jgi:hypothetical protein